MQFANKSARIHAADRMQASDHTERPSTLAARAGNHHHCGLRGGNGLLQGLPAVSVPPNAIRQST
jgi:hypothetical protein